MLFTVILLLYIQRSSELMWYYLKSNSCSKKKKLQAKAMPCYSSDQASHLKKPGLIPAQSIWHSSWGVWQW